MNWERAAVSAGVSFSLAAGWLNNLLRLYLGRREAVELEACELTWWDRVTGGQDAVLRKDPEEAAIGG